MTQDPDKEVILHEEYAKLPTQVRDWLSAEQLVEIINDINENAGIYSSERRQVVPRIIFRLVVKDLPPSQVVATFVLELKIKQSDAEALSEEIAERIFAPIRQTLLELGVDVQKIAPDRSIKKEITVGVSSPMSGGLPGAEASVPKRLSPEELEELAKRYDASRPENENLAGSEEDRAAILEMQKKKMETVLDVGGKTFMAPKTTTLPSRAVKIDSQALPTFLEEGDMVRLKEAVPASAEAAPFMLHEESELETVAPPKTFRSNVEANYPRKIPSATLPVKIEIGARATPKPPAPPQVFGKAPASYSSLISPTANQPGFFPPKPVTPDLPLRAPSSNFYSPSEVSEMGALSPELAQKVNTAFQKQPLGPELTAKELPAVSSSALSSLSKDLPAPPVSPPTVPTLRSDPKVQGNTLDLRNDP